jgi:pilus assembly protein CpaC
MSKLLKMKRAALATTVAAALTAGLALSHPMVAIAQPAGAVAPRNELTLSVGQGQLVQLAGRMTDLFVANEAIADVQVRSPNQIYIFGKGPGNTTVYATDAGGRVIYSANVRVGQNLGSVDQLLQLAMPDADIRATPLSGMVVLTGTVAQPADVEEAQRLVQAYVGENTQVISRLRTATPLQVMLQVKIAEVSRTLARDIGVNLGSADQTGGFRFGIGRGRAFYPQHIPGAPVGTGTEASEGVTTVVPAAVGSTLFGAGRLLGVDLLGALDLGEQNGLVTTLAEPNLTALSGETASFLAGGEFPIPSAQGIGGTSIEFKQYGVSLAFTPTVLEGGRISMRVRPEVSELSNEGSIQLNGFRIPSLTTRRAETTVELGSGQSFMIGGLLRNSAANSIDRTPGLGSLPVIGALFRSTGFRRNETELVIVVTPYLVRPVDASQIALPTDGYRVPNEAERLLLGTAQGRPGGPRPQPRVAGPDEGAAPGWGAVAPPAEAPVQQARRQEAVPAPRPQAQPSGAGSASPGFDF